MLALALLLLTPALQSVERVELAERRPLREDSGLELVTGSLWFAFDPLAAENAAIVDLELAPRDADGRVRCRADLVMIQPIDPSARVGTTLLEVSNRGGRAAVNYFGEDFLVARGLTVAWVGWQADVPREAGRLRLDAPVARAAGGAPITGLVRCDWTVDEATATLTLGHRGHLPYAIVDAEAPLHRLTLREGRLAPRRELPRAEWSFSSDGLAITRDGGFAPGGIYELVYRAQDPLVIGLGLAAVRDAMEWMKSDPECPFPAARGVALGISQTGRFLRHFLWQGFNRASDGSAAFDGMLIHTAGAGRGSFNHRFAQPSRDAHRYSAFFYPTDLFPFSGRTQRDPETGARDGVYARARASGTMPKVFLTNTGYEYWGRAAALTHVSCDGAADLEPLAEERWYHLRGAQHYPGAWPWRGGDNPLDLRGVERALLATLLDWVERGVEPPPSRVPRMDDGTLVPLEEYAWPEALGPRPRAAHEAYRCDYGPRWAEGIADLEPPALGKSFPVLVPQVDGSGNEIAGAPNLETSVPLGVWVPWSLRADGELSDFTGRLLPFSPAQLAARYPGGRADFLARAAAAVEELVQARFLLPGDRASALVRAGELWDRVTARD
jgi:hypothetical protein